VLDSFDELNLKFIPVMSIKLLRSVGETVVSF